MLRRIRPLTYVYVREKGNSGLQALPEVLDNDLHTLTACPEWECERDEPEEVIGPLDLTTLVQKMVTNRAAWEAVASFAGRVLRKKEVAERREQNEGRSA